MRNKRSWVGVIVAMSQEAAPKLRSQRKHSKRLVKASTGIFC